MLAYIVPFLVRNVATTTLVSALSLVVTVYKFKLRRKRSRATDRKTRKSNPMTWLSRCRTKSISVSDTEVDRQTRLVSILCIVLQQTYDIELQVQLCSLQDHITRIRRLLYVTDCCLGVIQERLASIQRHFYTLGHGQPSPSTRTKTIAAATAKPFTRSVTPSDERLLRMFRVTSKVQD